MISSLNDLTFQKYQQFECQNDIEVWSMENPLCIPIPSYTYDKLDKLPNGLAGADLETRISKNQTNKCSCPAPTHHQQETSCRPPNHISAIARVTPFQLYWWQQMRRDCTGACGAVTLFTPLTPTTRKISVVLQCWGARRFSTCLPHKQQQAL